MLFAGLWLGEKITLLKSTGFVLGIAGVGLVTGIAPAAAGGSLPGDGCSSVGGDGLRFRQCLYQEVCRDGESTRDRRGSQLMAGLILLPLTPLAPPPGPVTAFIAVNMILFALLSSGAGFFALLPLDRRHRPD